MEILIIPLCFLCLLMAHLHNKQSKKIKNLQNPSKYKVYAEDRIDRVQITVECDGKLIIGGWIDKATFPRAGSATKTIREGYTAHNVLGVSASATKAEITSAYRKMSKHYHPDQGGSKELFILLQKAYEEALKKAKK